MTVAGGPPSSLVDYASAITTNSVYFFGGYSSVPLKVIYAFNFYVMEWSVIQTSDNSVVMPPSSYGGVLVPWGLTGQLLYMFGWSYGTTTATTTSVFLFDFGMMRSRVKN